MTLDDLGPRIYIMGPSNSGKSTLAVAIARAKGLPPIHLDQLHHMPGTNWQVRANAEFVALHDAAILEENWVIDGKYSQCLPQRLARATGLILLDLSITRCLWRYLRRSLLDQDRLGGLEGGRENVKWEMIHHIVLLAPASRRRYQAMLDDIDLPQIRLSAAHGIDRFYAQEGLER